LISRCCDKISMWLYQVFVNVRNVQ